MVGNIARHAKIRLISQGGKEAFFIFCWQIWVAIIPSGEHSGGAVGVSDSVVSTPCPQTFSSGAGATY